MLGGPNEPRFSANTLVGSTLSPAFVCQKYAKCCNTVVNKCFEHEVHHRRVASATEVGGHIFRMCYERLRAVTS